jgi:hypothetical protein
VKVLIEPQRPVEYWMLIRDLELGIQLLGPAVSAIEKYGTCGCNINQDVNGNLAKECEEMKPLLAATILTVCEKFNVMSAEDLDFPSEKETLRVWSKRMEEEYWKQRYEKIICSACPFGLGWETMKTGSKNGIVPCHFFLKQQGGSLSISAPLVMPECPAIGHSYVKHVKDISSLDVLKKMILEPGWTCFEAIQLQYNERNWEAFVAKSERLKKLAAETPNADQV